MNRFGERVRLVGLQNAKDVSDLSPFRELECLEDLALSNTPSRTVVDRNAKEADVKVVQSGANELCSILGLPLQGTSVGEYTDSWLPRMSLDDALICGSKKVSQRFGSSNPGESGPIAAAGK